MGLIKPVVLGFVLVTIGCHVGLRTQRRHAGRRPGDDERGRRRVGRRAGRGLPRDEAADRADVLTMPTLMSRAPAERRGRPSSFDDVSLAFDDKVILDGVSFTLLPGGMKIILGASGAGKSTILRLILGLLKPDGGRDLRGRPPRRRDVRGAT